MEFGKQTLDIGSLRAATSRAATGDLKLTTFDLTLTFEPRSN